MFARYGRVCVHCGAPATDIDHLIPIGAGGDHAPGEPAALVRALQPRLALIRNSMREASAMR